MMERYKQDTQIRTNIVFEFNVVGSQACNELKTCILEDIAKLRDKNLVVSLVGLNLRKPTANFALISKDIEVAEIKGQSVNDLIKATSEEDEQSIMYGDDSFSSLDEENAENPSEEEVLEDDKESDRND